eukprot:TRINITY_DN52763_c0_g1_i1.p1 TRINITY_DN52763_c0_g1~~TRINITY_DN52763_c0_g1_i1.p1  ORF type:complete len:176 (-),score=49.81 TRINITY_DN52763_c0_g1_i1:223-750(-)
MGKRGILFMCQGNSCRSILAESILRKLGSEAFESFSGGSRPSGVVNEHALSALKRHGALDSTHLPSSKSVSSVPVGDISLVITLCAPEEGCPVFDGGRRLLQVHWETLDPSSSATLGTEEREKVFDLTFQRLEVSIQKLLNLGKTEFCDEDIPLLEEAGSCDASLHDSISRILHP